jgi:signal peptidase I
MSVDANSDKSKSGFWETVRVIIIALLLAFVVRIFLFQPFNIPSGSMKPTLLIGDYLFVSKFSYGYSQYSFPFGLTSFDGRILASKPKRGDVAVFKLPSDNESDYIKRIVGLPGDRIRVIDGLLHINGKPVRREPMEAFTVHLSGDRTREVRRYRETLPNGVSYQILDQHDNRPGDNTDVYVVPPGHYFMMGDNRDNSSDSRFFGSRGVGFVPAANLIGRAEIIFFSVSEDASIFEFWAWPFEIRWSRLFSGID